MVIDSDFMAQIYLVFVVQPTKQGSLQRLPVFFAESEFKGKKAALLSQGGFVALTGVYLNKLSLF